MAGIGFELKKLFRKKSFFSSMKAYGYAGVICAGPMFLGVLLLFGIIFLCNITAASSHSRSLIMCMVTYSLLASQIVSGFFSMVVTRFLADMLYEDQEGYILPSFWGSSGIMLTVGGILYGTFLLFSGISPLLQLLCFGLFGELIVVWNAMSYLTAIKDYRGILCSYGAAALTTFLSGYVLLFMGVPHEPAMMLAVFLGYGMMLIWDVVLLYRYFPQTQRSPFVFLQWMDKYLSLAFTGLFMNAGLFAHLVIMWAGPIGVRVQGLFYCAPYHDTPALLALLTTLVTIVNFVISVEVNFYPKYRTYYGLFNNKGSIADITQAEDEMLEVLSLELKYTALKQLFTTVFAIALGGLILSILPLGFNDLMEGYFRILCVGYGIYAVANTVLLILLYFTDYKGAFWASLIFLVLTVLGTLISLVFSKLYYGYGFLLGCSIFYVFVLLRLDTFTKHLPYYILSVQPLREESKSGFFTRLGHFMDRKIGGS